MSLLDVPNYHLFGLRLRVPFALPLTPESATGQPDYLVDWPGSCAPIPACASPQRGYRWNVLPDGWSLGFEDTTGHWNKFRLWLAKRRIEVEGSTPEHDLGGLLLGPIIATLIYSLGYPVWHGTTLSLSGRAITLAGASGRGKSTLAVALLQRGLSLVSDDLTVTKNGRVIPGYPLLRLTQQAAMKLTGTDASPRVFSPGSGDDKRWLNVTHLRGGFSSDMQPLQAIYILGRRKGHKTVITPLVRSQAVAALMSTRFTPRWITRIPANDWAACAGLAERVSVKMLEMPDSLTALPVVVDTLLDDAVG
ncbi:MAG: hypothetical protein HQK56_11010 [Deltaproteobacteria bacterium]|nr:hypothetical protein [Deltaproteobacteria bacterium]